MITLLPPTYKPLYTSKNDLSIASIAWGFTLGVGAWTTWTAIQQTLQIWQRYGFKRLNSPYVWMIWLEITVCLAFSVICYLHLYGFIPPSFAFYFVILTFWALQVQFLLQIIINRIAILMPNRTRALQIKIVVAIFITAINISVYCIWIPARLQISEEYIHLNDIWDRCEKCIYLVVDATLNWYFIRTVKKTLVVRGLTKYNQLVQFNIWIVGLSLSMDALIIGMMSLSNSFVYMQFHPLAYIVKLKIEMSMATLIAKISQDTGTHGTVTIARGRGCNRQNSCADGDGVALNTFPDTCDHDKDPIIVSSHKSNNSSSSADTDVGDVDAIKEVLVIQNHRGDNKYQSRDGDVNLASDTGSGALWTQLGRPDRGMLGAFEVTKETRISIGSSQVRLESSIGTRSEHGDAQAPRRKMEVEDDRRPLRGKRMPPPRRHHDCRIGSSTKVWSERPDCSSNVV